MVPDTLHDFLVASTGTSAALIGLLFVAVSVAPERIFGSTASGEMVSFAGSAFIALANCLFISLGGLLPHLNIGWMVLTAGVIGLSHTVLLIAEVWRRGSRRLGRGPLLTIASLAIYIVEIWWGIELLLHPDDMFTLDLVTYVLLGAYAVGLRRAWELVGGRVYSLGRAVFGQGRDTQPAIRAEQDGSHQETPTQERATSRDPLTDR